MPTGQPNKPADSKLRLVASVLGIAITLVAVAWFWPRSEVTLDEQGYDITLALYRVCNQQDAESLEKIHGQIMDPSTSPALGDESRAAINKIIAQAKSGNWQSATVACRAALDDQIEPLR